MVDITQRTPATGALKGARRMSSRRKATSALRALQLQPNIHKVIRRPRPGIEKRQLVLVLLRDVGDLVVERPRLFAIDEERGVHDHLVADRSEERRVGKEG